MFDPTPDLRIAISLLRTAALNETTEADLAEKYPRYLDLVPPMRKRAASYLEAAAQLETIAPPRTAAET